MRFDELNEDNYILFAIKNYDNPQAATKEDFFEDMRRFKYIKRLLKKIFFSCCLWIIIIFNSKEDIVILVQFIKSHSLATEC